MKKKQKRTIQNIQLINYIIRTKTYQSCSLTVRSSRYIVFDKKSIPMVA